MWFFEKSMNRHYLILFFQIFCYFDFVKLLKTYNKIYSNICCLIYINAEEQKNYQRQNYSISIKE